MSQTAWQWDPTLFRGSAAYYARGRIAYPAELVTLLARGLSLDGRGRLLDVGCGPGTLTLMLAPLFTESVGVDADGDMLAEAVGAARRAGDHDTGGEPPAVSWRQLRAEELPAGLGTFRVVTFAQSFHWMDRARVAAAAHGMVEPGGACVHVHADTLHGIDATEPLPHPRPPHERILDLIRDHLGPLRRAGLGVLPEGKPFSGEDAFYAAAGFTGPELIVVPGRVVTRTEDDLVAAVFSQSGSTPHLLGERRPAFERELRGLLADTAPDGVFSQRTHDIALDIWRPR